MFFFSIKVVVVFFFLASGVEVLMNKNGIF